MKKKMLIFVLSAGLILGATTLNLTSCNGGTTEVEKGTVVIGTITHGKVTASKLEGNVGDEITLTVTADDGYALETLTHNGTDIKETKKFTLVKGENKIEATFVSTAVSITLDTTELAIDEIGKTGTITATIKNTTQTPTWTITDETNFTLTPSSDGLSCEILNVNGGTAVVTVSVDGIEVDCTVKGSIYGDQRVEYTVYDNNGNKVGDFKGLFNAVNECLNGTNAQVGYYVTKKDEKEVVYTRGNNWLVAMNKDGINHDFDNNENWEDGHLSAWFNGFGYNSLDNVSTTGMIFNESSSSEAYSRMMARGTNFSSTLFLDGYEGYSTAGNPANSVWVGWRNATYSAGISAVHAITWADPYKWKEVEVTYDLSDSMLTPSLNENQDAIAQIYLGTSVHIGKMHGIYFDAGTIESTSTLIDGTERDIYTFSETPYIEGGLNLYAKYGSDRTIGTTSIGKAKWDAFNKCWTFPDVTVSLVCDIYYSGEEGNTNASNYYYRDYTISGYKDEELVNEVKETDTYTGELARGSANERTIWGVSFAPKFESTDGTASLPDITCGAKWLNIRQTDSTAYKLADSGEADDNLQFVAGRSVNYANQLGLYGGDTVSLTYNTDQESIINFIY